MISDKIIPTVEANGDRGDRKDESAFPLADHGEFLSPGLTKREWFAAMALKGFLASDSEFSLPYDTVASYAVRQADALIAALQEPIEE
jgi:hypothetical protein